MREDRHVVADAETANRHVFEATGLAAMRERRHATCQRTQYRCGLRDSHLFERASAGQHEHDDRPGEVLAEERGREDRNACEMIGGGRLTCRRAVAQLVGML